MHYSVIDISLCKLAIYTNDNLLCKIEFLPANTKLVSPQHPLEKRVAEQLQAYGTNPKFQFDLPISYPGTEFQQRLWEYLPTILIGTTQTYGEVASALHSGARAIGNACRRNPLPLIFPCHRVVAKHKLGGFAGHRHGHYLSIKERLLAHESGRGHRLWRKRDI